MPSARKKTSRKSVWQADKPFNALPLLPPKVDLETRKILKQCISARAALAELKHAAELIPNQSVLINTLPLLEAQASSEIENIVTTTDLLFQFREVDDNADAPTREALRYSRALLEGFRLLRNRPLATRMAEEICTLIKGTKMKVRRVPGTTLTQKQTGEIDPLIRMAVAHYQFEAIHPFTDGNGRTGRVLNSLFFISQDLLTLPILYLSRYIIQHKTDYYRLLREVTREDAWEDWVMFMLKGVEETARWTVAKIAAIRKLQAHTVEHVRKTSPKIYSHELVNLIFELPYCRIQNLTSREIAGRQTASVYLKELVRIGVLEEKSVGREKLFIHPKLMLLLTRESNDTARYT